MTRTILSMRRTRLLALLTCALILPFALDATGQSPSDTTRVQTRTVHIISADSIVQVIENGQQVRQLLGNVRLKQEDTDLWADRAVQYLQRDEIVFTGRVQIVEENDTLNADRVTYNTASKVGLATGNVRLSDGEAVATAPSGRYFVRDKRAEFDETVHLQDSVSVLTSGGGVYWTDEKRAEFFNQVRLSQRRSLIESDSLTHFRDRDYSIARGDVFIEQIGDEDAGEGTEVDSTQVTYLFGDIAHHDNRVNYSRVEGNALVVRLEADSASTDTTVIRSDIFETTRYDSLTRITATGSVQIWQERFASISDSAVFDRVQYLRSITDEFVAGSSETIAGETDTVIVEDMRLYRNPIGWFDETQITGESIRITRHPQTPDTLFVDSDAFVASWDSTLQKINQLKGRQLKAIFVDDELSRMHVGPNAEAIYFAKNDSDELDGAVKTTADSTIFLFSSGELERIESTRGIEGVFHDAEGIPEPFVLEGFQWVPEQRPTKEYLLSDERIAGRMRGPVPEFARTE